MYSWRLLHPMSQDCSRCVWMCAWVFVVLQALLLVWQTGIFCSFGFCQSYLLGCVVYWLLACMLELCLLSGLKDCCLFIFTVRKNTLLFFHFYFAAQQASLLIWSKSVIFWVHQLAISGITIRISSNCLWLYLKSLPCLWIRWEKFGLLGKHFWLKF